MPRYIGLISGTSMDGIDAALVSLSGNGEFHLEHGLTRPISPQLAAELHALCDSGADELRRMMAADRALGEELAATVSELLITAGRKAAEITAIGSHGQTLRHYPEAAVGSSLQVGDPNVIAELTGITTVADFRRRDMAAGGQGAPLAPAFHAFLLGGSAAATAVLNLGGIANLTLLASGGAPLIGFDCGPANTLLDRWVQRHRGEPFDRDGRWAATGTVIPGMLANLLADPYITRPPPKSTGREYFNLAWLEERAGTALTDYPPADVQATLVALTARSVAAALELTGRQVKELLVCGGGVHNPGLMAALVEALPDCRVASMASRGVDPDLVEAAAFAWLAHRTLSHQPGNAPAVTGAIREVVLGAVYPAAGGPALRG